MNTYSKFNEVIGEEYWNSFVEKDKIFYDEIEKHIKKLSSNKKIIGLDIGAGPGIGAWLLDKQSINSTLYGLEPSENYKEGEKLAEKLVESHSKVKYISKKGEMKDAKKLFNLKNESLDFILILRAAHEVILSYKNHKDFEEDFQKVLSFVKKKGRIIIADPKYSDEVTKNPEKNQDIINSVRDYKNKTIGHSHDPSEYLTLTKLKELLRGFTLKEKTITPNIKDLNYLKSKNFMINSAPTEFFVCSFIKN